MRVFTWTATAVAAVLIGATAAPTFAAADPAGPPLSVPGSRLASSVHCHGDLTTGPTPVLLVPGTFLTDQDFSWNYERGFTSAGRPWCAVTLPDHGMGDIQTNAEYVVNAIRTAFDEAGRRIAVVGFSQGGMVPRWALKFWPDTRAMVDDLVGLDPSNHGTIDAVLGCAVGGCAPALWQQRTGSALLNELNAGQETYAGISYTQMYSATDEIVAPNFPPAPSSALTTGPGAISNVLVQDICPLHVADHFAMGSFDPIGFALVNDALTHAGPASAARISRSVCLQLTYPAVDPLGLALNYAQTLLTVVTQLATYPHVPAEPALRPYAAG